MKKYFILFTCIFVFNACSQEKTNQDVEFPILAWIGVPEAETTVERFKELKESGININFSGYSTVEAVEKALNMAQEAGVKLLPSCPELKSDPEETVKRLMKHPALYGYHIVDEPAAGGFKELGEWVRRIQAVDNRHPCYINLLPNWAPAWGFGTDTYTEYVDSFIKEVPVPFISFDHYPVIVIDSMRTLRPEWYNNLEFIAETSKKTGLPFWAFALTVAHVIYPIPTVGEIKLQMYSNLAYGAQTLQYFTYWNPGENPIWDFHRAPIDLKGKRTDVYDRIKLVNREIHHLAGVFLDSKLVSVWHTGKQIPDGTRPIDKLPDPIKMLETSDGGAIVSVLEKGEQSFLVIVNRDFQNPMNLTILTDETVKKVLKDGSFVPANAYSETMEVDPGDVAIYTWKKNALLKNERNSKTSSTAPSQDIGRSNLISLRGKSEKNQ